MKIWHAPSVEVGDRQHTLTDAMWHAKVSQEAGATLQCVRLEASPSCGIRDVPTFFL